MTQLQSFISLINLSIKAKKGFFIILKTKFILQLVKLLIRHKYLIGFKQCSADKTKIIVFFKFNFKQSRSVIVSCTQISKFSRPVYLKYGQWTSDNTSLVVLSTHRGLLTQIEAEHYKIGGLLLFKLI